MSLCCETSSWTSKLEWPQEVVCLLEVWSNCVDLVDEIVNRFDADFAEGFLDDLVIGEGNSLLIDLSISSLEH